MDVLLLRVPEAAKQLAISRSKCYELIAAGVLPSIRVGASVRVPRAELIKWIESQQETAGAGEQAAVVAEVRNEQSRASNRL